MMAASSRSSSEPSAHPLGIRALHQCAMHAVGLVEDRMQDHSRCRWYPLNAIKPISEHLESKLKLQTVKSHVLQPKSLEYPSARDGESAQGAPV